MSPRIFTLLSLITLLCISGSSRTGSVEKVKISTSKNKPASTQSQMFLHLKTAKRTFRVGEEIEITAYLENKTNQFYYVPLSLSVLFIDTPFHGISLSIKDARNKEVSKRAAADPMPGQEVLRADEVESQYFIFAPGMIYGTKDSYDLQLPPGTYKLRAKYYEYASLKWSQEERKALAVPVWTQELFSNVVIITIGR
ncbi:MAG TPA: hypothetical protein VEF04_16035 [Blastocatellia bacterium]|nr:hypothetical protein [Blastocatellia bacterium]